MQKIYSWTACHFDKMEKLNIINQTITSLVNNGIDEVQISISFSDEFIKVKDQIINYLKYINIDKITIYSNENKKYQFDHLENIFINFKGNDNDKIFFCDDDDLLLQKIPLDIENLIGYQYIQIDRNINNFMEKYDYIQLNNFIDENKNRLDKIFEIVEDFSGYMTTFSNVRDYFENRNNQNKKNNLNLINALSNMIKQFEDTEFMEFLDNKFKKNNLHFKNNPIIFHKLYNLSSTWKNNLIGELKNL